MARLRAWHLLPSQTVALCCSTKPGATCGLHAEFLKLETSSPSYSYSLELVTIPVPGLYCSLGLQFQYSMGTAWAQPQPGTHGGLCSAEAGRGARPGGPTGAPSGLCQGGTPEYSHPFPRNPEVSACSSMLSTAPQHWAARGMCGQVLHPGDVHVLCDNLWSQSPGFHGRDTPFLWPTAMLAPLPLGW